MWYDCYVYSLGFVIDVLSTSHSPSVEKVMFFLACEVMHCCLQNHISVRYLLCFLPVVEDGRQEKQKDKSQFGSYFKIILK